MSLWMDGVEIASLSGIDNDIRRVQYVTLGAWNIDAGTRGTLFFDAFESRRETYIGAAAGALEPPEPPARPDAIFADGFEAGDLSAWSLAQTDGGDLSVSTQAVLTGTYGLQAVLDDNYWLYVADWNPVDETRYQARFHFDPNSITMADLNAFFLMLGYDRDNNYQFMIEFRYASGAYQIRPGIVLDNKNWVWAGWTTVLDGHMRLRSTGGRPPPPEPTTAG